MKINVPHKVCYAVGFFCFVKNIHYNSYYYATENFECRLYEESQSTREGSRIQAKGSLINRYYTAYMVDLYSYSFISFKKKKNSERGPVLLSQITPTLSSSDWIELQVRHRTSWRIVSTCAVLSDAVYGTQPFHSNTYCFILE